MIRAIEPTDADALTRMMSRCSPRTRYLRFHGVVTEIPPAYLRRCLSGEHTALVAALVAKTGVVVLRMEVCRTPLLTYLTENLPVLASQQHGCDVTIDVDVWSLSQ